MDKMISHLMFRGMDEDKATELAEFVWKMAKTRDVRLKDAYKVLCELMKPGLVLTNMRKLLMSQEEITSKEHANQIASYLFSVVELGIVPGLTTTKVIIESSEDTDSDIYDENEDNEDNIVKYNVKKNEDFSFVVRCCVTLTIGIVSVAIYTSVKSVLT